MTLAGNLICLHLILVPLSSFLCLKKEKHCLAQQSKTQTLIDRRLHHWGDFYDPIVHNLPQFGLVRQMHAQKKIKKIGPKHCFCQNESPIIHSCVFPLITVR